MIVKWKRASAVEYAARWMDNDLRIGWSTADHNWQLRVNGRRVDKRWGSVSAAIDCVDEALNRRIVALGLVVAAAQRPLSTARVVRHG